MDNIKYALGMGDTEYLSDGEFSSLSEAHSEALRLAPLPHDNGDYHDCYVIGEVVPASAMAVKDVVSVIDDITDLICEHLADLEIYNYMTDDIPNIDDDGKAKILAAIQEVMLVNTTYPTSKVIDNVETHLIKNNL